MGIERDRVNEADGLPTSPFLAGPWHQWGPYLAERAWGGVREDYSADGDAWRSFPYDQARSRSFRWNEDGMAGICTMQQDICLALALWNGRDDHLKERMFGLTGPEGNHGEDVKEYWWYTDATPSHSWLQWRYHYPQAAFPYEQLREQTSRRGRGDPEFELLDTGVFDEDRYWGVEVTYAKQTPFDIAMRISITNHGPQAETLHVLPTMWFRNTWQWGAAHEVPVIELAGDRLVARHHRAGTYQLLAAGTPTALACQNLTNTAKVYGSAPLTRYPKDGINDHVVHGADTVDPDVRGTKAAWWYQVTVAPGQTTELRLLLSKVTDPGTGPGSQWAGTDFDRVLLDRKREADEFYQEVAPYGADPDELLVMRQAFAGMIWGKQFYRYDVSRWLDGDPGQPAVPPQHLTLRNANWRTMDAYDVISMPDPWEYPWFAAWDLAFHTAVLAHIDPPFAKYQLLLMLREWYSHPNGAMPAYEWNFDDVNPPVHAWAALRVFAIDGATDYEFLAKVFQKLLMNFTWWLNRVDPDGNHLFAGGFLGLDNIGPINRSSLPEGWRLEQSDGTAWMAFYSLTMLRIAMELTDHDHAYGDMALRFLEHFALILGGIDAGGLWDPADGFFYDRLLVPGHDPIPVRTRSLVGVLPLMGCAVLDSDRITHSEDLRHSFAQFTRRRRGEDAPQEGIGFLTDISDQGRVLLSLIDPQRLRRVLTEVCDPDGMLSDHGIRGLSKRHREEPVVVRVAGQEFRVAYEPAESQSAMFGGNSNWRGPVWIPTNVLIIESLYRFHHFLGDAFTIEYPTGSGAQATLEQVADDLVSRLIALFLPRTPGGQDRPLFGGAHRFLTDPAWGNPLFYEYFNGDDGAGLGASHQTGWTGYVAALIIQRRRPAQPS